jgi:hypothetical protein
MKVWKWHVWIKRLIIVTQGVIKAKGIHIRDGIVAKQLWHQVRV